MFITAVYVLFLIIHSFIHSFRWFVRSFVRSIIHPCIQCNRSFIFTPDNFIFADPPRVLSVTVVPSLTAVNISWNSTNDNTGIKILDYRIILMDTATQKQLVFFGIEDSILYVSRLRHNRTYVVMVQARNEDGYGQLKSKIVTTLKAGMRELKQ